MEINIYRYIYDVEKTGNMRFIDISSTSIR